jgi:hypothetical protein
MNLTQKKPTTPPNQIPPTSLLKAVLVGRTIRMCLFLGNFCDCGLDKNKFLKSVVNCG